MGGMEPPSLMLGNEEDNILKKANAMQTRRLTGPFFVYFRSSTTTSLQTLISRILITIWLLWI